MSSNERDLLFLITDHTFLNNELNWSALRHLHIASTDSDHLDIKTMWSAYLTRIQPFIVVMSDTIAPTQTFSALENMSAIWCSDAAPLILFASCHECSVAYGLAFNDTGVPVDKRFFAKGCHAFRLLCPTSDPITTIAGSICLRSTRKL